MLFSHQLPEDAITLPRRVQTLSTSSDKGGKVADVDDGYKDPTDTVKKYRNYSNSALPKLPPRDEDEKGEFFVCLRIWFHIHILPFIILGDLILENTEICRGTCD